MINSLNELSSVYLNQIAEQEQTPEAVKQRVSQMVKAIRYRARKEAVPVSKAFNDYIGSVNATSVERQYVKERLGLTGGISHKEEYVVERTEVEVPTGNIAKLVKKASARIDSDVSGTIDNKDSTDKTMGVYIPSPDGKKKIYGTRVKESFSNWRQDLSEVMDEVEASKEIKEKKVKNKVIINPVMKEAVEELGGELIEMIEFDEIIQIDEKALSKQQQKFMGMVYAVKKGRMAAPSPEVAKAAAGMTTQQAKDFAKTKHKGLPSVKEAMDEIIDQGSGTKDKDVEMQRKKIQAQKIRDLNIRLQAARKGVY